MWDLKTIKRFLVHLSSIFSFRSLILSAAAVIATLFCMKKGWVADYPMALIGTAVIFPIVFSINSAYHRREEALAHYARIKANLRSIYFTLCGWQNKKIIGSIEDLQTCLAKPLFALRDVITVSSDNLRDNEPAIYKSFSIIAEMIEFRAIECDVDGAEKSACRNYLNTVMVETEELKHIFQYRTPRALQAFSDVFITILPILYGPVFASIALSIDNYTLAFLVPALFAFVLSSLDNIQADLEDPFDGIGVDDMVVNAEVFHASLRNHTAQSDAGRDSMAMLNPAE